MDTIVRALTLTQPWASAVALQVKQWETRSWSTAYRGDLFIHAAKGFPDFARTFAAVEHMHGRIPSRVPLGAIVAVCRVVRCLSTDEAWHLIGAIEKMYGDYGPGRFAFELADVLALRDPVPAVGHLGLWIPDAALVERVKTVML